MRVQGDAAGYDWTYQPPPLVDRFKFVTSGRCAAAPSHGGFSRAVAIACSCPERSWP